MTFELCLSHPEDGRDRKTHLRSNRCLKLLGILLAMVGLAIGSAGQEQSGAKQKWTAPAGEAQKKNPVPADESSLAAGHRIYQYRCVSCHGTTGNGDGTDAIDLGIHPAKFSDPALREEEDGALFWKITTGKKPMPDYGRKLSPTDRWNVINYLRTLTRR
jgi:mono/diheme cytochrome c family protein